MANRGGGEPRPGRSQDEDSLLSEEADGGEGADDGVPEQQDDSDLQSLKDVRRADVYKSGDLAGHLVRGDASLIEFRYTSEWIKNGGAAVATTLPVSADPVVTVGGAVPPFFAGLLPEGRRLAALRQGVKTSADDELSLLLGVGGDTIGDVRVVPEGQKLDQVPARLNVTSFEQVLFSDLLKSIGVRVDRVGLPGVQDKVSAAMLNLPVAEAGASTLLKLNPAQFKHLVENEHFFLGAARQAGIRTVQARLVRDSAGQPGLAVTRFDRVAVDGQVVSLPVEDGCQVLGLYPSDKYVVTTERLFAKLSSVCEAPVPAAAEFLAQISFAYLTANGDAHAKNFSVMQDLSRRWQPTPAYDVPTSQVYDDQTMALAVDGRRDENISGSRFIALGREIGLPEKAAKKVLKRVADSVDSWIDGIEALPFDVAKRRKLKRVVRNRQQMLRNV